MLNSVEIKQYLADHFDLIGVCPAVSPNGLSHFYKWLEAGYAGEMQYLSDRKDAYAHPRFVMEGVKSIMMLGSKYAPIESDPRNENTPEGGLIARYARNPADYHDVIHRKLKSAIGHFSIREPSANFRGVVDTAPLLEREFAQLSGIGWQGKNTLLISKTSGSWFFLSAILTDLELQYDQPFETNHCGSCTACLDACPTDAFVKENVLDARRCLSYWNIESQSIPPPEIREKMSNWLFGCDICQEVCPWNRKIEAYVTAEQSQDLSARGAPSAVPHQELVEWLSLTEDEFRQKFRRTAMWRSKRRGILRNVLIILGNTRNQIWTKEIACCLNDPDPLIRASAAWALGELEGKEARMALKTALELESERWVAIEMEQSLSKNT